MAKGVAALGSLVRSHSSAATIQAALDEPQHQAVVVVPAVAEIKGNKDKSRWQAGTGFDDAFEPQRQCFRADDLEIAKDLLHIQVSCAAGASFERMHPDPIGCELLAGSTLQWTICECCSPSRWLSRGIPCLHLFC